MSTCQESLCYASHTNFLAHLSWSFLQIFSPSFTSFNNMTFTCDRVACRRFAQLTDEHDVRSPSRESYAPAIDSAASMPRANVCLTSWLGALGTAIGGRHDGCYCFLSPDFERRLFKCPTILPTPRLPIPSINDTRTTGWMSSSGRL